MKGAIKCSRDFWAGLMYFGFGAAAVFMARDYGMGSASRMGPGYFPMVLGALLMLFGAIALLRALLRHGEPLGAIGWKALLLVSLGTLAFALLLRPAGFLVAVLALILISAAASVRFRLDWRSLLAMLALVAFCGLLFVKGLGVPMPLLGSGFGG